MAMERMNDSYDRCLFELRERYKDRGISLSVKSEMTLQAGREESTRALSPESYVLFDARSKIADQYRSGDYNGSKYMTSDDFVRYFKTRRAFYMPQVAKEQIIKQALGTFTPTSITVVATSTSASPRAKDAITASFAVPFI